MTQDLEIISANLLPGATNITDNDMILIVQGGRLKRALPSAMKGREGDPGLSPYLGVSESHIQWKQGANGVWQNLIALDKVRGPKGEKPVFRKQGGVLQMKYEGEPNSSYQNIFDKEELRLQFSDLTPSEIDQFRLHFSDLTEADKVELMKPATDAAAAVIHKMTEIEQSIAQAIQNANAATEKANTAADSVEDGKTPVITIGTVEDGGTAAATLTAAGTDESGNPKSALNLVIPKGDTGPAPVLELGEVATVEPSDQASATFEPNGTSPSGANKYRLGLSIPKGKAGQDGTGAGNVIAGNADSLLAAKQYAFKPGQDGSLNGSFVEVEATDGAIEIPAGVVELNPSSTSEQILSVWPMEDILKVIKGKPGGLCYVVVDGQKIYVQTVVTVSENPATTPHEIILTFFVIAPGANYAMVVNIALQTDESTVSVTDVLENSIGIIEGAHDPALYGGILVPVKDKESGYIAFLPWYDAVSYQYVILNLDKLKTATSEKIKEMLKASPIISQEVGDSYSEFKALKYVLSSYGKAIAGTGNDCLLFMESSESKTSLITMSFRGGDTLYTVTIAEDPTSKELSATVVESNAGQKKYALDLSPFFAADNNTISDEYYNVLQKAYEDKLTTGLIDRNAAPIAISMDETEITIAANVTSVWNFEEFKGSDFNLAAIEIIVKKADKTFSVVNDNISFTTRGDGTFALMNDGEYGPVVTKIPPHTLDLSPLFDSEGNPVTSVPDDFISTLQKAYDEKYSNCTAVAFDNAVMPMTIQKTGDGYTIAMSSSFSNDSGLAFLSYNFVINTTSKTLSFTPKGAQLETAGDGTKFLSNDGMYKAIPSSAGNIYNLDIDISGEISKLDANMQKLGWGKTYTAPTNDNIIELLGGIEGIRQLCDKLAPANNPIVTVPFLAYIFPGRLMSSAILLNILNSEGNSIVLLGDGCRINIILQFQVNIYEPSNVGVSISITNFNTSTQTATYDYSFTTQSSGQTIEVLDILNSTNSNAALSANQGRVLKGLIDNIKGTTVENTLTSSSTTNALSAAQGKTLKGLVDGKVGSSEITTIKKLTQSAYNSLSIKDSKTLYIIV